MRGKLFLTQGLVIEGAELFFRGAKSVAGSRPRRLTETVHRAGETANRIVKALQRRGDRIRLMDNLSAGSGEDLELENIQRAFPEGELSWNRRCFFQKIPNSALSSVQLENRQTDRKRRGKDAVCQSRADGGQGILPADRR